jgi:hypothetical protein
LQVPAWSPDATGTAMRSEQIALTRLRAGCARRTPHLLSQQDVLGFVDLGGEIR